MNITETVHFDKDGQIEGPTSPSSVIRKLFLPLVIILVGLLGFGMGRLSGGQGSSAIKIEYDQELAGLMNPATTAGKQTAAAITSLPLDNQSSGGVVASKTGTKYHYSYCPGAKQIKEANKIVFASAKEAEASGYSLAGNCTQR